MVLSQIEAKGDMRQVNNSRRSRGRSNGKRQPRGSNQIDSHGPEVRVRGTAQQVFDKYLALGRDATTTGDRIIAENMFQHAEHYSRIVTLAQENAEQRNDTREERGNRRDNEQNINPNQEKNELGSNQDTDLDHARDDTEKPNVETKTVEENPLPASSSIE
jgi:hypothetical protein